MKTCTVCGIEKLITDFEKGRAMCKPCRLLKKKETYRKARSEGKIWATDPHKRFLLFKRLAFNVNNRGSLKVTADEIEQHLGEPKTCWLCGETVTPDEVQIDHIHPLAKGGTNTVTNLAYAHSYCNYIKRDHTIDELKIILEKIIKNI